MREAYKEYAGDSGPNWILDLDGPDGNVYALWGILKQFADLYGWEDDGTDMVEESKNNEWYEGYEGVLDYCISHLSPSPAAIEFRMYGEEVSQVSDYHSSMAIAMASDYHNAMEKNA
tara:strand:+ start:48 stop:398 length:351 start_codon:yes stop_codon:yes gene_type:complete